MSKKLGRFLANGKEKMHLVLDFDRTMTKSQNQDGQDINTWQILKTHLPPDAQEKYKKFYDKYRPLEVAGKMKNSDARKWWSEILNLYKENRLKWLDIIEDIQERMPMRQGVKELFYICRQKDIPTIIISAGIKDIIELWCQKNEIKPSIILSTNLFFDDKGIIKSWDKKSLVHVLNKKEKGHKEINQIRRTRPNTVLVGDSMDDYFMVSGTKNVLRIIVDDPRPDDKVNENKKKKIEKFDLIIRNKTLLPVVGILKLFK